MKTQFIEIPEYGMEYDWPQAEHCTLPKIKSIEHQLHVLRYLLEDILD